MPKFNEDENHKIDRLIRDNKREIMKKIKDSEDNIKLMQFQKVESSKENSVRDNMKVNLVTKLSEFTQKLQLNEEQYMKKYKELVGDPTLGNSIANSNSNSNNQGAGNQNFLKFETNSNDILQKRDNEINELVSSISELASIYKDFQTLVLEQGTILDRIDYNIDSALINTKNANKELNKAEENMKSNCSRNANIVLIVVIFVLSMLLVFKYF